MGGRRLGVAVVCGLAAAAGGGMWVMRAAERASPVEPAKSPPAGAEPEVIDRAVARVARPRTPVVAPGPALEEPLAPEAAPAAQAPAQTDDDEGRRREWDRMRTDAVRRFDQDGDGELSEAERAAARAEWEERAEGFRRVMMQRYDKDGDGELSGEEREAAREEGRAIRQEIRDRIVPEYDLDGDGELNEEEREAAGPAFREEFERVRVLAMLDRDGSRTIDSGELAQAILGVADGDPAFDLNRDGVTDYRDATYATDVAQGG